jgi:hypothetical protein
VHSNLPYSSLKIFTHPSSVAIAIDLPDLSIEIPFAEYGPPSIYRISLHVLISHNFIIPSLSHDAIVSPYLLFFYCFETYFVMIILLKYFFVFKIIMNINI